MNRKAAQALCIALIDKLVPGGKNKEIYEKLFESMSDEQFDSFIKDLKSGNKQLSVIAPNFDKTTQLTIENNFKVAKELGHEFFERIWFEGTETTPTYLSPLKYLVVKLPARRQAQLLTKKISIPEHNTSVDDMTGQPTGSSKGSKISYPQLQVLAAIGADKSLTELIKYRGGDAKGFNAMNTSISRTGQVSQKEIEPYSGGVESTRTLKTILTSMMLDSTLMPKTNG